MSKHTPGPWTHEGQGDITGVENDTENGCVGPVDVCSVYLRTVDGRHQANARLIAAAPTMLDALIECVGSLEMANFTEELAVVNAAIAKATG